MPPTPFFSICIPQHNRTSFLIEACRSIERQHFKDLEICISDDCSTDGREREIQAWLERSGLPFTFRRRDENGRYDKNLRSAMDLARGEYLLLLGNDDALKEETTLGQLFDALRAHPDADVVLTNFEDFNTGALSRRVDATRLVGSGPQAAVAAFRKFSFVGGVVIRRRSAEAARTDAWDGSEMYQMYVGCRVIAAGGRLLEADVSAVRKDIHVSGESVDAFTKRPREVLGGIPVQAIPVTRVAALVVGAVGPYVQSRRHRTFMSLVVQYYGFLCPYWLLVYRRVQSWRFAAGVARAFAPSRSLRAPGLPPLVRVAAWILFIASTVVGLAAPLKTSRFLFRPARRLARRAADLGRRVAEAERS